MLFSNERVATFLNSTFEPVWESVRPVPIVRIDFGNGHALTRTLHGNIASYVCTADGLVLDVLPGIYTPEGYQDALQDLALLARQCQRRDSAARAALVRSYHERLAVALRNGQDSPRLSAMLAMVPVGKGRIERPVERVLAGKPAGEQPAVETPEDLARWEALVEDTRLNEKARRLVIHEHLARTGLAAPSALSRWLYREVLHADLDDPYLGLGKTLLASDPFAREQAGH